MHTLPPITFQLTANRIKVDLTFFDYVINIRDKQSHNES